MHARECDNIILAAGLSSRMQGGKLLRDLDGQPLVRIAVRNALAACRRVILVVGHRADELVRAVGGVEADGGVNADAGAGAGRLVVARNPRYRAGMVGSIQAGMRRVTTDWFFITPADMPGLTPRIYEAVARAAGGHPEADVAGPGGPSAPGVGTSGGPAGAGVLVVVPFYRETRGHPVLVSASLIPLLLREPPDAGPMRAMLAGYPTRRADLDEPAITLDIDTEASYQRYLRSSGDVATDRWSDPAR